MSPLLPSCATQLCHVRAVLQCMLPDALQADITSFGYAEMLLNSSKSDKPFSHIGMLHEAVR